MITKYTNPLTDLYEADETAWLDAMAKLAADGHLRDFDLIHLAEYLADMAKRDRREVSNRLAILIAHVLKWTHQPDRRTKSWKRTIVVQRQALAGLLESGTLQNHAETELSKAYASGIEQAAAETGLDEKVFPGECPWSLDQLLTPEALGK